MISLDYTKIVLIHVGIYVFSKPIKLLNNFPDEVQVNKTKNKTNIYWKKRLIPCRLFLDL